MWRRGYMTTTMNKFCGSHISIPLTEFFSRGPYLSLVLSVAAKSSLANYFKSEREPIFEAAFEPVHPWRLCGPPAVPLEAGVLSFQHSGGQFI